MRYHPRDAGVAEGLAATIISGSFHAAEGLVRLTRRTASHKACRSQRSRSDAQSQSGPRKALDIASWLFKGGVGKTTNVVNLGGYFASAGIRTDDPHYRRRPTRKRDRLLP